MTNGYYETNQSKLFGISLNANPARFDLSKEGGNTWIPFFLRNISYGQSFV